MVAHVGRLANVVRPFLRAVRMRATYRKSLRMGPLHRLEACLVRARTGLRAHTRSRPSSARDRRPLACGVLALCGAACTEVEVPPADAGADAQVPGEPVPRPPVKQLALGAAHGCSLDPAISGVVCWGDNRRGQAAPPWLEAQVIAAGGDTSCAIAHGGVTCWGDGSRGQLEVPPRLGEPVQLAVGEGHVCMLNAAGAVRCWGDNRHGQADAPVLRGARAIAAGARHSCALGADGVRCWGDNSFGQLDVPSLARPVELALGAFHGCAIDAGRVLCWGGASSALREQVPALDAPRALAAGGAHSCVLDAAGVQCWGDSAASGLAPRELTLVQQLAVGGGAGLAHACARHQQGVACWGDNSLGQTEYSGYPLHVLYRAEAEIAAPPALVWDVLMDLESYPLWNPYTIAMESTLRVGDPMVMAVKMNELLTLEQIEHIRVLEAGHKVCWGIETTTPELNSGERCQWLEALPDGGTRYVTEDLIEGLLNPVVLGLFDTDLQRGFDGVARGLKGRAEGLRGP
jgi:hypothetical protein